MTIRLLSQLAELTGIGVLAVSSFACSAAEENGPGGDRQSFSVSQTWALLPGQARDVGAAGVHRGAALWIVGNEATSDDGYSILTWPQFDGGPSGWKTVDGGAVRITVDGSKAPWIIKGSGAIRRRNLDVWAPVPGCAKDIGASSDHVVDAGDVWIIGCTPIGADYSIHRWNGSAFEQVSGAGIRIAVDSLRRPWVVNSAGRIYRRTRSGLNGSWEQIPGTAKDIDAGDDEVWVTSTDGTIWRRFYDEGAGVSWAQVPGAHAINISVAIGGVWMTDDLLKIYEYMGPPLRR